jgi:trk system potassium uptake protein TrkH
MVITIGTLLLMMPFSTSSGQWNDPLTALFTSTSAVCVTGLIVVDTGTYFSFWGQVIILLLIQTGGLGYMTISTLLMLLIGRKFGLGQKLAIRESFDRPLLQGSQNLIRSIIATTLLFEITGIILMFGTFVSDFGLNQGLWLSIFHSISSWNNAGFSLFQDSLISYHSSVIVNLAISLLIIFGGIGYQVIMEMSYWLKDKLTGKTTFLDFSLNFKVVTNTTLALLLLGSILFFISEFNNPDSLAKFTIQDKIIVAWFQSVTTRTAGFNSIDIGQMTTSGLFITMGLMFIGASPSGTGGGIKTTALSILTNCTRSVLRGQEQVIVYRRQVSFSLILKAVAVVVGSVASIVIATGLIAFFDPEINLIAILFEVISAFATVGLSTGITATLSGFAKIIIILTMYIGRVGILVFMAAIFGDPLPSSLKYPEENLLVG